MKPEQTGMDEWRCMWYRCECQKDGEWGGNSHIVRHFKYCPDCGVEIDWTGEYVEEVY